MRQHTTIGTALFELFENSGFAMAGSVAFSFILSLFPFCIFLGALAGVFGGEGLAQYAVSHMFDVFPKDIAEALAPEVTSVMGQSRVGLMTASAGLALFFATSSIESLRAALNIAYRATETRSYLFCLARSALFVLVGAVVMLIMAWAVLKGLGANALVSQAEINASSLKTGAAKGCKVEKTAKIEGGVSFDRIDEALPMPIDERAQAALKLAPVLEDLNRLELAISDLPAGNYTVSIDGEAAGTVGAADLAKGWNFSNASGPITKQAREVLRLIFAKNDIYFRRWREVQLFNFPGWANGPEMEAKRNAELARFDQEITKLEAQIETARQPKSHHFEVKLAAP